jgi:putative transposase
MSGTGVKVYEVLPPDPQRHAPRGVVIANAFAESVINQFKRERLNHFICFTLAHLYHIVQTFAGYHNEYRPHQGLGNIPPSACCHPPPAARDSERGPIRCRQWLGGLLRHDYRNAA